MIAIRAAEAEGPAPKGVPRDAFFSVDDLIERPLLRAMRRDPVGAPVLLTDEIDRTDEPVGALLLDQLAPEAAWPWEEQGKPAG